ILRLLAPTNAISLPIRLNRSLPISDKYTKSPCRDQARGISMRRDHLWWASVLIVWSVSQASAEDMHVVPVSGVSAQGPSWLIAQALGAQEKTPKSSAPPAQPPLA